MGLRDKQLRTLKKGLVHQNWSRVNLFNLVRMQRPNNGGKSFFQQKWAAKAETRAYHGKHLTKRQWQNIFRHSLKSVMPMNTRVLAASDGSEFAAGRGSGFDSSLTGGRRDRVPAVPYMNQTYAPMERRLDISIFRAMFASSALQARQFVVCGFVKVNGKKMRYPQYMLNPGDMFSVDIEKVKFALGAPKGKGQRRPNPDTTSESSEAAEAGSDNNGAKESSKKSTEASESSKETKDAAEAETAESDTLAAEAEPPASSEPSDIWLKDTNNVEDREKAYCTPWQPRDYLSAFAFIPRYLEVNHNIGHAVYLRDPVARPGQSEVPTPFHQETLQLAYGWFLRRR